MPSLAEPHRGRPGYDQAGVLADAVAAFKGHGYEATSISLLADRLGISKSAIYHRFASKEQMLDPALGEALDALEGVIDRADASGGRAIDRLERVLRGATRVLVERLPYVTLL